VHQVPSSIHSYSNRNLQALQGRALLLVRHQDDQQKKASDMCSLLKVINEKERRTAQ